MRSSDDHLIRSVRFDTEADVEANASIFADAVSAIDHQLVFGKVLDKYNGIRDVVRIDKIELDLGNIDINSLGDLEEALARLLDEALAGELQFSYRQAVAPSQASSVGSSEDTDTDNPELITYSIEEKINLLLHYFKMGALPWNVTSQPDIEELLLEVMNTEPAFLRQRLLQVLRRLEVVQRIVYALRYEVCVQLLELYIDPKEWSIIDKIAGVITQEMSAYYQAKFKQQLIFICFQVIGKNNLFFESFITEFKSLLQEWSDYITSAIYYDIILLLQHEENTIYQRVYQKLLLQTEEVLVAKGEWKKQMERTSDNMISISEKEVVDPPDEKLREDSVLVEEMSDDDGLQKQTEFIDNSGLVLIASFLPAAFRRLNWVEGGAIIDAHGRDKMLLWMDYLVWGTRKTYEYNLSLNKVLVGMATHEVANISLELTDEEKAVADTLLESVIQHWSILKNTSAEGLRASFLQRNGKMHNEDGGWQLHVESKSFDLLIDRLPWSFSILKFPWMEKPLYTQWRTKI